MRNLVGAWAFQKRSWAQVAERAVIGGAGAFVMSANNIADYPARIRQKLLREVTKKIALADR